MSVGELTRVGVGESFSFVSWFHVELLLSWLALVTANPIRCFQCDTRLSCPILEFESSIPGGAPDVGSHFALSEPDSLERLRAAPRKNSSPSTTGATRHGQADAVSIR